MLKSDLKSAHQDASNGVRLFVISFKIIFSQLLKKMLDDVRSQVDSNSKRIMSVNLSVPEIFHVKDSKCITS